MEIILTQLLQEVLNDVQNIQIIRPFLNILIVIVYYSDI
jgi:hypothetical protein